MSHGLLLYCSNIVLKVNYLSRRFGDSRVAALKCLDSHSNLSSMEVRSLTSIVDEVGLI
jgi:hypothetical protein